MAMVQTVSSASKIGSLLLQNIAINHDLKHNLSEENTSLFQTAYESVKYNEDNNEL